MKKLRILYIAGYGRSGSTLLDLLLGNHPEVFGAGELTHIFREVSVNNLCSCAERYQQCPFWSNVIKEFTEASPPVDFSIRDKSTRESESLLGDRKSDALYRETWRRLLTAIHRESGAPVLVDSSKSTWKTGKRLALLKECGFDVRGIHLVRDPRGVMYSISKGSNRLLESGGHAQLFGGMFRGLLGWVLANLLAEISLLKENTFVRIRYEDLVADPVAALGRIGTLLGVDMQPVTMRLATGDSLLRGHGVSGNRMRRQGPVTIVNDTRWRDALPLSGRMLALVAWPLARRYGYDVFQEVRSFSGKVYRSAK